MKNFLLCLSICLCFPFLSSSQEVPPENVEELAPIKFIVGIEAGSGIHNVKGPGLNVIGLSLDIPIKNISIGTGILVKDMGSKQYMTYTGYSFSLSDESGAADNYEYHRHQVDLKYISIPLRIQLQLPWEILYLQGGVEFDFLKNDTDEIFETAQVSTTPENYLEENVVKDVNYTFVVGVGVKLYNCRSLQIILRPEYEFMLNYVKNSSVYNEHAVLNRLKLNLGIQYGI